jgi:hypothetical protein
MGTVPEDRVDSPEVAGGVKQVDGVVTQTQLGRGVRDLDFAFVIGDNDARLGADVGVEFECSHSLLREVSGRGVCHGAVKQKQGVDSFQKSEAGIVDTSTGNGICVGLKTVTRIFDGTPVTKETEVPAKSSVRLPLVRGDLITQCCPSNA